MSSVSLFAGLMLFPFVLDVFFSSCTLPSPPSFGQNILLKVTYISYEFTSLMVFKGYVNDKETTLIQHTNQLNFLLTSVDKAPDRPKHKIGFSVQLRTDSIRFKVASMLWSVLFFLSPI